MEQRQGDKEFVQRRKVDHRTYLCDIRKQCAVREHHALGFAFGAGGEQYQCRVFRVAGFYRECRERQRKEQQPDFVPQPELAAQVFEVKQPDARDRCRHFDQIRRCQKLM